MSVSSFVRVAALAATVAACAAPAVAQAKPANKGRTTGAQLRVIDRALGGRVSADFTAYTTTSSIKTSKSATCFGAGTAGSGQPFTLDGPTALGLLNGGAKLRSALSPLSVTDHFLDEFGPGLCGVGKSKASGSSYWDLIVNHQESQIGGGQKIRQGDDVLWYLAPSFPAGPELQLHLPSIVPAPGSYQATVYQYDPATGQRSPAEGVSVSAAVAPTDASGHTTVALVGAEGTTRGIGASRDADQAIPDAQRVCIGTDATCGKVRNPIYGSGRADRIEGTGKNDAIAAGAGGDRVNIASGGVDAVNCGSGEDTVTLKRADRDDKIGGNCEKVVKR